MKSARIRDLLAWALRPFAKVEPSETVTAVAMALISFLLLTAYYLLKTVREPLILLQGGAEVKLYARAAQGVIMVGVVHAYGELARRVGRRRLILIVFVFFLSNLVVFAFLAQTEIRIGLAFFLWVGVFSYTVVAQFWALAADIYSEEQGKRIFPILGGGSSVGAVAGSRLAKSLVSSGPAALMGAAAIILVLCAALIAWVERRSSTSIQTGPKSAHADEPIADEGAFHLLARDRYLVLIAGMVILLNWVNSAGEYILDRTLLDAVADARTRGVSPEAFVGAFKADYFAWYNLAGVLLQLFVVSRIIGRLGLRNALLFNPLFALVGYASAVAAPVLGLIRFVKIGENAIEYSLQDTARHALFLVTSRVEKFVGKTAVDTIAVRVGAILSAAVVATGTWLGMPTAGFALINAVLSAIWIGLVFAIGREHARRSGEMAPQVATAPAQ